MNAIEILGLACVDRQFRERLFADVESVIKQNRTHLTWAEESGLRRVTQPYRPRKNGDCAPDPDFKGKGGDETGDPNTLKQELEDVQNSMAMMCPQEPCPWPFYFTQNKQDYK